MSTEWVDVGPRDDEVDGLGRIIQWPGGYAMTLGFGGHGAVRCCPGHDATEDAKNHGLVRLIEVAAAVADGDIALWATTPAPADQPHGRDGGAG